MNTNRIKLLGLALPLLAIAVAVIVFAFGNSSDTTEAATDGAAMSLRVDAGQTFDCAGGPVPGKVCIPLGATFDVILVADASPTANGYILAQGYIAYDTAGLVQKKTDGPLGPTTNATMIWPDGEAATFLKAQFLGVPATSVGALTALLPPQPPSFYKGDLFSIELTCTTSQSSSTLNLLPSGDPVAGTSGALYIEAGTGNQVIPAVTGLNVNCNPGPTATPKPATIDLKCKLGSGGGDPQTKCDYAAEETFTINGTANYAADLDGNGTSGYHGVDIQVTWPPGLGEKKSSSITCPPGAIAGKAQPGINKWSGSCDISFQAAQFPECPIQPNEPFPGAGCDDFNAFGTFIVDINGVQVKCSGLQGPVRILRSAVIQKDQPAKDAPPEPTPTEVPNKFYDITTVMEIMTLEGKCVEVGNEANAFGIIVRESPDLQSIGRIETKQNESVLDLVNFSNFFPADSFFDVFVVVEIYSDNDTTGTPLFTLRNIVPQRLEAQLLDDTLPPIDTEYEGVDLGEDVKLFRDSAVLEEDVMDYLVTEIMVDDASVFSMGDEISVDLEQMQIMSILDNTLTVVRGLKGTSAVEHQDGATVGIFFGVLDSHPSHEPTEKTLEGPTTFNVVLNCLQPGTHKITASAVFTGEDKEPVPALEVATIRVNCPSTNPRMSKIPALQNVFLTRQGAKIPPGSCLATKGTTANVGELAEVLSQEIEALDPKDPSLTQQLAAFEFDVHYDSTKVCVDINVGAAFEAAGAVCIIEDDQPDSKPQLEGVARIGCVTIGKGHDIDNLVALASVDVYPQPEIYSQAKPNQDNGVVVQISNVNCDLSDEQGHAIKIFACDDADITFRYLEGDVEPDCVVDAMDAQAIAFRWGVEKGSLIYKDFMNLEPSSQQQDNDIDINDLQFVFGRFGSTCEDPHPPQLPVNPKA